MSLFCIADLHLPGPYGEGKSMEVFDSRWRGAVEKLEKNWRAIVEIDDTVVIPGDISWALKLHDALDDLKFIDSLPGRKLIGKGNHDFWWSTAGSMRSLFESAGITTIDLLYNNSYVIPGFEIVGARGWYPDPANQKTAAGSPPPDWAKISAREETRLKLSIASLSRYTGGDGPERILFIHFPPVWRGFVCRGIVDIMHESGIRRCYYGHIHGVFSSEGDFEFEGISFKMISADRLDFSPMPVPRRVTRPDGGGAFYREYHN